MREGREGLKWVQFREGGGGKREGRMLKVVLFLE